MSDYQQQPPADEPPGLQGSIESMAEVDDGVELVVRLRNPLDRAIHYISDVRGMIFDPTTRRFRVQLSDQGRPLRHGVAIVEPRFRMIDPQSEAVIKIRLPKTIVKLADAPSPTGELLFEEHAIADADEIELAIGWAGTPYYSDPREASQGAVAVSSWEQQSLRVNFPLRSETG